MPERPYVSLKADQLVELALRTAEVDKLQEILAEFGFRSSRRARSARQEIEAILNKLLTMLESFRWPATTAHGGDGSLAEEGVFLHRYGLLGFLGYKVGVNGVHESARRQTLDFVYVSVLPKVNSQPYMQQWGNPSSGIRLRKAAESIAAFCRNSKRGNAERNRQAVADWEADLAYLKHKYYEGKYDFAWPRTDM